MDMNSIIIAAVVIAAVGIIVGVGLGLFGAKFKVEVDEKEAAVREELPGNNCGGCGYPGCDGLAKAIAEGKAPVNACPVGGAPVAAKIAAIMGEEAGESVHEVAFVKCAGTCEKAKHGRRTTMPKLKTHSGAKKRFNLTKTGKVKRAHAFKSHILTKKDTKRGRRLRSTTYADVTNVESIKKMIPYK